VGQAGILSQAICIGMAILGSQFQRIIAEGDIPVRNVLIEELHGVFPFFPGRGGQVFLPTLRHLPEGSGMFNGSLLFAEVETYCVQSNISSLVPWLRGKLPTGWWSRKNSMRP